MSQANNPCEFCTQECPDSGCKAWRDWWVRNWNQNIHRRKPAVRKQESWQYEHPDRERNRGRGSEA